MVKLLEGAVTLLFTDVARSTELVKKFPSVFPSPESAQAVPDRRGGVPRPGRACDGGGQPDRLPGVAVHDGERPSA